MYIDFHSHILPGADHGSSCIETSLLQIEKAKQARISVILATPHFYPQRHQVSKFLERRESAFHYLSQAMKDDSILIRKGAEVMINEGLENLPDLEELCIENTNYILLEMPPPPWTERLYETVYEITTRRGLRPVMAHVDRYEEQAVSALLKLDVCAQINASALLKPFKKKHYLKLIQKNEIQVLGSDVHGKAKEYAGYSKAIQILKENGHQMMKNAMIILNNGSVL